MAENKTKPRAASVTAFIAAISDPTRQNDAKTLIKWMEHLSGEKATLWVLRSSVWALFTTSTTADVRNIVVDLTRTLRYPVRNPEVRAWPLGNA
jgi:hypothetical protein